MEKTVIELSLPLEAVQIIIAGLGELPAKHSKQLIDYIEFQAKKQLASAETEEAAPANAKPEEQVPGEVEQNA